MMSRKGLKQSDGKDSAVVMDGKAGRTELGALACDVLMLCIFLYNQLFYGVNMWFAIIPLALIGLYLIVAGVIPEKYHFTENSLEIQRLRFAAESIPYDAVFNLEMMSRDNFVNLLQENKVKVYHAAGKTRKVTICRPREVYAFAAELKKRCPEFSEDGQKSKLEVFFND